MDPASPAGPTGVGARGCPLPTWPGALTGSRWPALQDCPSLPGRRSVGRSGPERGGPGELDHQALCLRRYYESFTNCTEVETNVVGCYWPNPLAQSFITGVHRRYFHNCSVDRQQWQDPPDEILIPLIVVPILLTLAMTGLVVWRSKRAAQVV